ncbi:MAG: hypothetical protein KatS3mg059_0914 [Thermomicrobiales bacterium]|nr:MAG: hypothetical protein KatS3mg059_0914 [Thermomicrobiales bacterium]
MDSRGEGEQLSQLSRLLFDAAASKWYWAAGLELLAGLLAAGLSMAEPTGDRALFGAGGGVALLGSAYVLRLRFADQYDTAETIRRHVVLSEAFGLPLDRVQASRWRQKAGQRLLKRLEKQPRDPDYYTTRAALGARRLAEMTAESAFYTRHLYAKLECLVWLLFASACIATLGVAFLALSRSVPESIDLMVARALSAFIPTALSINLLGWGLRLRRAVDSICDVESALERLLKSKKRLGDTEVLQIVSEYSCQVVSGFPIHACLFNRWHGEIQSLWQQHLSQAGTSRNQDR